MRSGSVRTGGAASARPARGRPRCELTQGVELIAALRRLADVARSAPRRVRRRMRAPGRAARCGPGCSRRRARSRRRPRPCAGRGAARRGSSAPSRLPARDAAVATTDTPTCRPAVTIRPSRASCSAPAAESYARTSSSRSSISSVTCGHGCSGRAAPVLRQRRDAGVGERAAARRRSARPAVPSRRSMRSSSLADSTAPQCGRSLSPASPRPRASMTYSCASCGELAPAMAAATVRSRVVRPLPPVAERDREARSRPG